MSFEPITFSSGHQLVDNELGDYSLQCPDGHKHPGTVFPHQAHSMVFGPELWECQRCGVGLGWRTAGELLTERHKWLLSLTCKHEKVGQLLAAKVSKVDGRVVRFLRYRCALCTATVEAEDEICPGMPDYARYLKAAEGDGDGRG